MLYVRVEKQRASDTGKPVTMNFHELRQADLFIYNGLAFLKIYGGKVVNMHTGEIDAMLPWTEVIKIQRPTLEGYML